MTGFCVCFFFSFPSLCVTGTFITEWVEGKKICEVFLAGEEQYRSVADKLVQIAHCYGFDGWLVNIENVLSVSCLYVAYYKMKCSKFKSILFQLWVQGAWFLANVITRI